MKAVESWRLILVLTLAAGSAGAAKAESSSFGDLPDEAGIWRRSGGPNTMSTHHERRLIDSLRRITGLCELEFGSDGLLNMGIESTGGAGAGTARNILKQALHSGVIFVVEDHSGSEAVHFGQLEPFWLKRTAPPSELEIHCVRLDFKDFREMEAPQAVRETFDEGFTLLHELLHGMGYEDAYNESEVGPCEEIVNQARAELGLPLREQYLAQAVPMAHQFTVLRLRFSGRPTQPGGKARAYYLFFVVNDSLAALRALAESARIIRVKRKANTDRQVSVKVSLVQQGAFCYEQ